MNTQIARLENLIAEAAMVPNTVLGFNHTRDDAIVYAQAAIDAIRAGDKLAQARNETLAFENAVQLASVETGERLATVAERNSAKRRWTRLAK